MNYRKILLQAIAVLAISFSLQAKENVVPQVHRDIHRELQLEMEESQLFQAMVDSVSDIKGVLEVFDLFPALDIYTEWNDHHVDPMRELNKPIPNTAEISLAGYVPPCESTRLTSNFGWRRRRMHKGQDIGINRGDTIRAAFDGKVRIRKFDRRGYGYYYVIRHHNGLETVYGHLSRQLVQQDQMVKAGQAIGLGGSTGRSSGPHLHFEMRFMGIALDPADLVDFSLGKPREQVYHFEKGPAEWAQNNKGRRGARYNAHSAGKTSKTAKAQSGGSKAGNAGSGIHRVRKGDTLSSIAMRYGTTVSRLCKLNGIKASKTLQLGEKIRYK